MISDKIAHDSKYLEQMEMATEKKKDTNPNDFVCSVCHSSICIADNGTVFPCAGWQDYVVGNVKKTLLYDIWDHAKKVQYLRSLRKKDFPKCLQCPDKEFCTMCMIRNANENPEGDPLIVNEFFCNIAKLNRQIVAENKEKKLKS